MRSPVVMCASCSGPSDNETPRCGWCVGIDWLTTAREAARDEHERQLSMDPARFTRDQDASSAGINWAWIVRGALIVLIFALRMCAEVKH